jgi:hypothetical protein
VYVAGYEIVEAPNYDENSERAYAAGNRMDVAAVWQNGALLHRLGDGAHWSDANSVFVKGGDVYAAGTESVAGPSGRFVSTATVWKNGAVLHPRLDGEGNDLHSIHVSGKDVYVVARGDNKGRGGKMWKNAVEHSRGVSAFHASGKDVYAAVVEEKTGKKAKGRNSVVAVQKNGVTEYMLGDGSRHVEVISIWASGDVYAVGGEEADPRRVMAATVWKNGVAHSLGKTPSFASSVYVSGKDVYVVSYGWDEREGKVFVAVWKNGAVLHRLGGDIDSWLASESTRYSVRVSGGDVYVLANGGEYGEATSRVWKNGAVLPGVDAFCVSGGDVYLAGHDGDDALTIWKNGKVKHRLPKGEPRANVMAVFVE